MMMNAVVEKNIVLPPEEKLQEAGAAAAASSIAAIRRHVTRRDKGLKLITERDEWVLKWIAEQYAVRFDQLAQLLSRQPSNRNRVVPGSFRLSNSAVGQVVRRWEREPAWVEYERIYRATPGWVWLTPYAERMLELPYRQHYVMREGRLMHRYYVSLVRLNYERRHPEYRWVSERTLLAHQPQRYPGKSMPHIPDGEVERGAAGTVAIEVELSAKTDSEIDAILMELLGGAEPHYRAVWYFVSNRDPLTMQAWRVVRKAADRLPAHLQNRMQIIPLEKIDDGDEA